MAAAHALAVEAKALTKEYATPRGGGFRAVDGVDVAIYSGECFGFLGPNGAGKTTTMRMIQCVSPITSGTLTVLGMDVRFESRAIKARLGVVPQESNLDPDLHVRKNLLVYARYFDIPPETARSRAAEALEFFQLSDRADSPVESLSGGMKRRLVIARALINQPDVLILDEPTTGLDPQARRLVWQKLRQLRARGVTMILTTHYMEEAAELCDRLVVMDRGRIAGTGTPAGLVESLVGRTVLQVRTVPEQAPAIAERFRGPGVAVETVEDTIYFHGPDDQALRDIAAALTGTVHETTMRAASLEDVFLRLTGHALQD